jgi:hypothetical protein
MILFKNLNRFYLKSFIRIKKEIPFIGGFVQFFLRSFLFLILWFPNHDVQAMSSARLDEVLGDFDEDFEALKLYQGNFNASVTGLSQPKYGFLQDLKAVNADTQIPWFIQRMDAVVNIFMNKKGVEHLEFWSKEDGVEIFHCDAKEENYSWKKITVENATEDLEGILGDFLLMDSSKVVREQFTTLTNHIIAMYETRQSFFRIQRLGKQREKELWAAYEKEIKGDDFLENKRQVLRNLVRSLDDQGLSDVQIVQKASETFNQGFDYLKQAEAEEQDPTKRESLKKDLARDIPTLWKDIQSSADALTNLNKELSHTLVITKEVEDANRLKLQITTIEGLHAQLMTLKAIIVLVYPAYLPQKS